MSFSLVVLIGVLFSVGTYLIMQRSLTRIALGVGILANGVNVLILATSARQGTPPFVGDKEGPFTDPLPQALVLTAIVIGFALTAFLVAMAWRSWTIDGNDLVEDDVEDRLIVLRAEADHHGDIRDREDVDLDVNGTDSQDQDRNNKEQQQ